jgi:hypothetical protein
MRRHLRWFDARSRTAINTIALLFLLLISAIDYVPPAQVSTFVWQNDVMGASAEMNSPRSVKACPF